MFGRTVTKTLMVDFECFTPPQRLRCSRKRLMEEIRLKGVSAAAATGRGTSCNACGPSVAAVAAVLRWCLLGQPPPGICSGVSNGNSAE